MYPITKIKEHLALIPLLYPILVVIHRMQESPVGFSTIGTCRQLGVTSRVCQSFILIHPGNPTSWFWGSGRQCHVGNSLFLFTCPTVDPWAVIPRWITDCIVSYRLWGYPILRLSFSRKLALRAPRPVTHSSTTKALRTWLEFRQLLTALLDAEVWSHYLTFSFTFAFALSLCPIESHECSLLQLDSFCYVRLICLIQSIEFSLSSTGSVKGNGLILCYIINMFPIWVSSWGSSSAQSPVCSYFISWSSWAYVWSSSQDSHSSLATNPTFLKGGVVPLDFPFPLVGVPLKVHTVRRSTGWWLNLTCLGLHRPSLRVVLALTALTTQASALHACFLRVIWWDLAHKECATSASDDYSRIPCSHPAA